MQAFVYKIRNREPWCIEKDLSLACLLYMQAFV